MINLGIDPSGFTPIREHNTENNQDQNTAYIHFKNAWEKGAKNRFVLANLIKLSFHVDKKEKENYFSPSCRHLFNFLLGF